jgi:hypothetical protein
MACASVRVWNSSTSRDRVADAGVDRLDKGALPKRARLDVGGGGGVRQARVIAQGVGDELRLLRPVVAADVLGGDPADGEEAIRI